MILQVLLQDAHGRTGVSRRPGVVGDHRFFQIWAVVAVDLPTNLPLNSNQI